MSTQPMTDEELLTEYLKTKNHDLFTVLHERMQNRMYAHAMQMTKSPDAAEEIVQDVFCKLLEVSPQEIRSANSFLFRMIWTHAIDFYRAENAGIRKGMISLDALDKQDESWEDSEDDDHNFDPLDDLVDRRRESNASQEQKSVLWKEVEEVLEILSPKRREAIEAYYCSDRPTNEIADKLGIPYETFRARIRRGMATLRASLAPENAHATIRRRGTPRHLRGGVYTNAV